MEGKLRQVSEKASERSGGIMRKYLHQAQSIPSIPDDVVLRMLHRES